MLELVSIYIFHTKQSILKPINLLNQEIVYLLCLLKSKKVSKSYRMYLTISKHLLYYTISNEY